MSLTDAELRELLELEAVATSAPWQVQGCGGIQMDGSRDGYMIENRVQRRIASLYPTSTSRELRALDARLITTARNLARPLADEVLLGRKLLFAANAQIQDLFAAVAKLDEEVLRLREALRRAGYAIDSMRVADVMQCSHPNIQAEIEEALRDAD